MLEARPETNLWFVRVLLRVLKGDVINITNRILKSNIKC
jgi:hypothetical protein